MPETPFCLLHLAHNQHEILNRQIFLRNVFSDLHIQYAASRFRLCNPPAHHNEGEVHFQAQFLHYILKPHLLYSSRILQKFRRPSRRMPYASLLLILYKIRC